MAYAAVLDADVLHPAVASDLLLRLVERGLFRAVWSPIILDELRRSLVDRGIDPERVERRIGAMSNAFEEAMVEPLRPCPRPSTKVIATSWLRHSQRGPTGS